jgi:hypothetical protein
VRQSADKIAMQKQLIEKKVVEEQLSQQLYHKHKSSLRYVSEAHQVLSKKEGEDQVEEMLSLECKETR